MPRATDRARSIWLLAAACAAAFFLLAVLVAADITAPIDAAIIDVVRAPSLHDALAPLAWVTALGSTWAVVGVGALVLVVGSVGGRPREAVAGALTIAVGSLIIESIKRLTGRARPDVLDPIIVEVGFSFPSGHAANAMVAYGVLGVLVWRLPLPAGVRVGTAVVLGIIVFGVGLSRVWLGVHFPTDVVAGWLLGAAFVLSYAAITLPASPGPASPAADEDPAVPRSDPPAEG